MRHLSLRIVLLTSFIVAASTNSFATSGWDRHSVDVADGFRIHGTNGSRLSQIDVNREAIEPPLAVYFSLPEYAVTPTHIVLRGYNLVSKAGAEEPASQGTIPQMRYVAVSKADSKVIGPMTEEEFVKNEFNRGELLNWATPKTAADSFDSFLLIVIVLVAFFVLFLVSIPLVAYSKPRKRKQQALSAA